MDFSRDRDQSRAVFLPWITITIANAFFFESVLKFALKQVERRTNIAIRFEKAEGSLWSGRLYLKNLSVARQDHPCSRFEIEGDHVEVRLSVTKLFFGSNELQTVRITGFRGTWEQVGKAEKLKPRRLFRIDRLVLEDVQLDFADHTRGKNVFEAKINIDYLESSPLRSQWAVFDVLFRSNATGKINGVPFEIDSEKGRHFFRMEDVPIRLFSAYFDLLRWCDEGKVDLLIDNTFAGDEFVMRWSVVFREIHAKVPDEADLKTKALAM